jgi:hypothetical protein
LFGARELARKLSAEVQELRVQRDTAQKQLEKLGAIPVLQLEARRVELQRETAEQTARINRVWAEAAAGLEALKKQVLEARSALVVSDDLALLQEAGVYQYRHPLTDAVAYEKQLAILQDNIKAMVKKDGGAVLAINDWTVNGSAAEGRTMVRDFSKLMLRAFNAEADNLVRGLKPYKLDGALDRLKKVSETIERLGKTMKIRISTPYYELRVRELELTADFLQKQAEEKEAERLERERLREERKVQIEIEQERARLEKERQHHANALEALVAKGDQAGAARMQEQLADINKAIEKVDYRAANIRAGYVYVISNIGSFGDKIVKVGLTRRLDPMDRIKELSDASVPFNFDVHALHFSNDAVGLETKMRERLANVRVNLVNRRREFFRITPLEAKAQLSQFAGELLEFTEIPEALEYRQCLRLQVAAPTPQPPSAPSRGAT